jgi:hypothetical protein
MFRVMLSVLSVVILTVMPSLTLPSVKTMSALASYTIILFRDIFRSKNVDIFLTLAIFKIVGFILFGRMSI